MTSSADDKKQLLLNCQNQEIEFKRDSAYFFSKTCQLFTKEHLIIEKEIKNYTKDSIDNLFSTMLSYYLYKDGEKDITVLKTNIHVDELPNEYWWIFIINRNKVFLLQYPNLYELERK